MASETHSQVLVEEISNVRILTLNRPKKLNALSLNMINRLLELFLAYEEDPSVKLIILKGQGRAFCAGDDVSAVVRDIRLGKWRRSADFMSLGYTLNYVMATYSKDQRLTALEADLCRIGSSDPVTFASTILDAHTQNPHPKHTSACHRLDVIDKCFSRRTVEEIIYALERERPLINQMIGSQLPLEHWRKLLQQALKSLLDR